MPLLSIYAVRAVRAFGAYALFLLRVVRAILRSPGQPHALMLQLHQLGARSLPVIAVAGFFTGMVVAVQFFDTLVRFGSRGLLGTAVGLSLIRELGPVLTALIAIGRAGSASCAEMAIMRTDQQIDAIECMAIDPHAYLLAPRLLAFVIALPLLTAIFEVFGIFGGVVVALTSFGENAGPYLSNMADGVLTRDLLMGAVKSLVFGLLIGCLCLGKGYMSAGQEGAEGVSRTTTDAVVIASLAVLFMDYVLSALLI
jgi:phospholipid/cholesterol/gamma-HCH transport system permease protein